MMVYTTAQSYILIAFALFIFIFAFPAISTILSAFAPLVTSNESVPSLVKFLFQLMIPIIFFVGVYWIWTRYRS